ncbi:hypothetical protein [Microbacterium stercoris]|uniref:Uncharacterized protein n=1 Tax=Microbacterium stercoris TaxID=2820289 RepID=A0A939QIX1_9MICO|nr:hypothetical protein [Microbacterium stercoris]MBO3663742.1 hypothetical protein [Microbacterium stercoris]
MSAEQHIIDGAAALRTDDMDASAAAVLASYAAFAKLVDADLANRVHDARSMGLTWQQIGDILGLTRQAAHTRYAHSTPREQS